MLNFRIETFINLCETKNYTQTAKNLCITQPAVTQHIKYLEKKYNLKLFNYAGKILTLTDSGEKFLDHVLKLKAFSLIVEKDLSRGNESCQSLDFGATRTIGEFLMPNVLKEYMTKYPKTNISMIVENTQLLIDALMKGKIEFALVEGHFNRADFETHLISKEEFVMVVSPNNELSKYKTLSLEDLLNERIIVREAGSGSRKIFETVLYENNYSLNNFNHFIEIGNINAIKTLVKNNIGISFMYKRAVEQELISGELVAINIENIKFYREFNLIFLKNSILASKYIEFFNFILSVLK